MKLTEFIEHIRPVEGWLTDHEAMLLYRLSERIPVSGETVEIGSWKGKSTICLSLGLRDAHKKGTVTAIDPHQGVIQTNKKKLQPSTYKEFLQNIKQAGVEKWVTPVVKTSKQAVVNWKKPIRLLFIDGLHDYDHAKEDYTLWNSFVVQNGVIAFHDGFCGEEGVWKSIHEGVLQRNDIQDIGTVSSIFYVVIGTPNWIESLNVFLKKQIVYFATWMNKQRVPWVVKLIVIHKILRFFLLQEYTVAVYEI